MSASPAHTAHSAVTVCKHPVVQHHLSILRDKNTPNDAFRSAMRRIGQFLFHEATHDLPVADLTIETPICRTQAARLTPDVPIIVAPILRAALMLGDIAVDMVPTAHVYHIGLYRDEETLKPVAYYNKLPAGLKYPQAQVFVLDPMLATGGSGIAAVEIFKNLGTPMENIRFVCMIAAPEGIQALTMAHPGIRIFAAAVDERLNDKAYIVPGLGDAGDRAFGTGQH